MSITRINTNTDALMASANLRKLEFGLSRTMSHLSSGLRITNGSDDPSGVALMGSFNAQLSGTRVAIQNAEDGLSLLQLADTSLSQTQDMLLRMRDLAVRASSEATLTSAQRYTMEQEVIDLRDEIDRKCGAITFNTKVLFDGTMSSVGLQVGPDNITNQGLTVTIPTMSAQDINGVDLEDIIISTPAGALSSIDYAQSAINMLSDLQASIGVQEKNLERVIIDLQAAEVNIAASASRISDADMALEVSQFARQQVLSQAATAMIAQANAQPQQVLSLLGIT